MHACIHLICVEIKWVHAYTLFQRKLSESIVLEPSHPSGADNLPFISCASKTHHLPEKFAAAAIYGEYMDFSDILSALSVLQSSHSNEGMLCSISSDLIAISRPQCKCLINSFNLWFRVWTKYKMEIVSAPVPLKKGATCSLIKQLSYVVVVISTIMHLTMLSPVGENSVQIWGLSPSPIASLTLKYK